MSTEPPDDGARTTGRRALLGRLQALLSLSTIALLAGLIGAALIAGYLWLSDGDESPSRPSAAAAPERGVACPQLREAFVHSRNGDEDGLLRSVNAAARAGERALDTSGQSFGRPEEIALELQYALSKIMSIRDRRVRTLLEQAQEACEQPGR
jgi:hypothetical protein